MSPQPSLVGPPDLIEAGSPAAGRLVPFARSVAARVSHALDASLPDLHTYGGLALVGFGACAWLGLVGVLIPGSLLFLMGVWPMLRRG